MRKIALAAAMIGLLVMPALAQTPPRRHADADPRHGREARRPKPDGQSARGTQADDRAGTEFHRGGVVKKSLADIKAGDFVASPSIKGTDGKLHAIEVLHLPPRRMPGVAEGAASLGPRAGQRDDQRHRRPASRSAPAGGACKVSYKGGESEVVVGPDVPVVAFGPRRHEALLKPGAAVFADRPESAGRQLDGGPRNGGEEQSQAADVIEAEPRSDECTRGRTIAAARRR